MFGAISEKFRTFDMQINFAIPPISHFRRWLGEFFFPLSKLRNFYHFINQLVRKVENFLGISRQSLIIQKHVKFTKVTANMLRKILYYQRNQRDLAELLPFNWKNINE